MDKKEFLTAIEAYYGRYDNAEKKKIVMSYIHNNFADNQLDDLYKKIILNISSQYKVPPDVATIKDVFKDNIEIKANKIWEEICRKANCYRDIVFGDPAAYMAFKNTAGSLEAFSLRPREDEHWTKKRFVDLYILYAKNPQQCDNMLIRGMGETGEPVMIGDLDKCRQVVDNNKGNKNLSRLLTEDIKRIEE